MLSSKSRHVPLPHLLSLHQLAACAGQRAIITTTTRAERQRRAVLRTRRVRKMSHASDHFHQRGVEPSVCRSRNFELWGCVRQPLPHVAREKRQTALRHTLKRDSIFITSALAPFSSSYVTSGASARTRCLRADAVGQLGCTNARRRKAAGRFRGGRRAMSSAQNALSHHSSLRSQSCQTLPPSDSTLKLHIQCFGRDGLMLRASGRPSMRAMRTRPQASTRSARRRGTQMQPSASTRRSS